MKIAQTLLLGSFLLSSCSYLGTIKEFKQEEAGKQLYRISWAKDLDIDYESGNLPISRGTPLAHEGLVYAGSLSGDFSAFDMETGRIIWKVRDGIGSDIGAVAYKDQVIYGTNSGRVFSRNLLTGKIKYAIDLGYPVDSVPLLFRERVLLQLKNHRLACLDASTGKLLWAYQRSIPFNMTINGASRPLVLDDKLVVGFADGHVVALSLEEGVVLWERRIGSGSKFIDVDASPLLFKNRIWLPAVSGPLALIHEKTGNLLRELDFPISHKGIVTEKGPIFASLDGRVARFNENGDVVFEKQIANHAITSITRWKGMLVLALSSGVIKFLDLYSFQEKGSFDLGTTVSSVYGDMQTAEGQLFIYSSRNRLYSLK